MTVQEAIALEMIVDEPEAWPRFGLDPSRVAEFMNLYYADGPEALPPVEIVPDGEGRYITAEGWHRVAAARALGWAELPARVLTVSEGSDPIGVAYVRGLETAATAAKPLSTSERRAAVRRLIETAPQLSDRQIGRLVGVAHTTASRQRAALHDPSALEEETEFGDEYLIERAAAEGAQRLLKALERVREMRGLGLRDAIFGDRMGSRLAEVLESAYGEQAMDNAQAFADWIRRAIAELRTR